MTKIRTLRLATAVGLASVLFYGGCAVLMPLLGKSGTVTVFNALMHGLNVEPILRMDVPLQEEIIGAILIFVLGWLFGVLIGTFYNFMGRTEEN